MSKYNVQTKPQAATALKTTTERTVTHEGAPALAKDARTELFTLAVTSMTGEDSFYESASTRDSRLRGLVRQLAAEDPGFVQKLVPWLRNTANMRSAPIVIAAEYAIANGPNRRQVIDSAMSRADEPGEFIGYYKLVTGRRTLPAGIQRGVADAVQRLFTEFSALKYDSSRNAIRMGDVIEMTHPKAKDEAQGALYEWLLDKRHNPSDVRANVSLLPMVSARASIEEVPEAQRREFLRVATVGVPVVSPDAENAVKSAFEKAGVTWEYISGWLPGGMDAEAWEAAIPNMGYMALLRNLRNFDDAKLSEHTLDYVAHYLRDPEKVAKSRQFPYRFWSAYKNLHSVGWGPALEEALRLSVRNIPGMDGKTLVMVDTSGSMSHTVSEKSKVTLAEVGALFGAALYQRNTASARIVAWSSTSKDVTPGRDGSILRQVEKVIATNVGYATYLARAIDEQYQGEDRIVIFTDLQAHDGGVERAGAKAQFVHYFDLAGYRGTPDAIGDGRTFMYGGFTDATFRQMYLNELTATSDWDSILS